MLAWLSEVFRLSEGLADSVGSELAVAGLDGARVKA